MRSDDPGSRRHVAAVAICFLLAMAGISKIFADGGLIGWLLAGFLLPGCRFLLAPGPGELTRVTKLIAALGSFVVAFVAGVFLVLESGEVVVLRYHDGRGSTLGDRLWVIDFEGRPSVTTGADARRVALIRADPDVELIRKGRVECRRAVVIPASAATPAARRVAEGLFQEKYGYRLYASRALRALLGGPGAEPVLIRLDPCG